nr:actin-related protein 5-like [Cherax quadricarinatus]
MRPFQSHFSVSLAGNPILDAWYGARDSVEELVAVGITRADYLEHGGDRSRYHKDGRSGKPLGVILCIGKWEAIRFDPRKIL